MTAGSLYGKLVADGEAEHRHHTAALHNNRERINRFGEAIKPLPLTPHIKGRADGSVSLVARSERGDDSQTLFTALALAGFFVREPVKPTPQFDDGYAIWTAAVGGNGIDFTLLYYIKDAQS